MTKLLPPLLGLLALVACHRADETPPALDFGAGTGISYRDDWGRPNGSQDPTDWRADSVWDARERALFSELPLDLNGPQRRDFLEVCYAYANPAPTATWYIETVKPVGGLVYNLRAVLVDEHGRRLMGYQADQRTEGGYTLSLRYPALGFQAGQRGRLYYVCYKGQQLLCKGHGDVQYQP